MIRRYTLGLIAVFIFAAFFCQSSAAKEDTAQISLQKTVFSKQNVHNYTVKKGDVISAIIRRIPGITEEDIPDNYRIIRELNPSIKNFSKLYAGQTIKIPGKSIYLLEGEMGKAAPADLMTPQASTGTKAYKVKRGDNLITIIHRELKIKTDTFKTVNLIKSINPRIANVNKIYTGQIIKLPGKTVFVKASAEANTVEQSRATPAESQPQPEKLIEVKEKKVMPPEARLAVVKQVVTQMNGSILISGNYYLPIPQTGQVTIDCSKIPVLEFDDKTTVFLDLENRINNDLKKMISDYWPNFYLVKVDKKDDIIAILKKIIATTKAYSMTKKEMPITIGSNPSVEVTVDWIIIKTDSKQSRPLSQGLRFVPENNSLLPKAIKNYAQQNGLIITEIDEETGLAGKPDEIYSLPAMLVLPATSAKNFSYELVTHLGYTANKDADVKIFDMVKDGFNLSIKADVLIKNADKKYIIYSRGLPQQFINVLKVARYELIFVTDSASPKVTMEKILLGLSIPYVSGYFTFSGVDRNQAPYMLSFSGTKIKTDKDEFVIDFDLDQGLRALLNESWSADIVRY